MTLKAKWVFDDSFYEAKENADVRAEGTIARVMSFNVLTQWYNSAAKTDEFRLSSAFNTIKRYAPDVIGVQEFDHRWYNYVANLDGYAAVNASDYTVDGQNTYTTLLYNTNTVKVVEFEQVRLPTEDNWNCRNVVTAVFEFISGDNIGKQFIATSTHWNLNEPDRVKQASEMSVILDAWEAKYPDLPVISTGDFNASDGGDAISKYIEETGYSDAKNANEVGLLCNTYHGYGEHGYNQYSFGPSQINTTESIDHIFISSNVTSLYYSVIADIDALNGSDHCPIYADINW